jgi:hypothetical protein
MGHFLRSGLRQDIDKIGDLSDDSVVGEVVDYLYSRPYRGGAYWRWLLGNVDKECLTKKILDSDRRKQSLFAILMELPCDGKSVLGEKTPGHLFYVTSLLEWFPSAIIVHILRDPRAICVSETRYRLNQQGSRIFPFRQIRQLGLKKVFIPVYVVFHTTVIWSKTVRLHFQYAEDYRDNYYCLKFEDLVLAPENELKRLCCFLDVEFQEEMMDQVVINTSFKSEAGKAGFDSKAVDRWREHINPIANAWFSFLFRQRLKEFGYMS